MRRQQFWEFTPEPKKNEGIFRIRETSSRGQGGANFYYHADVIARDRHAAMRAARAGLVHNWRWIDTFDSSKTAYKTYTYLGKIKADGNRPNYPYKLVRTKITSDITVEAYGVYNYPSIPRSYEDMKNNPPRWGLSQYRVFYKEEPVAFKRVYPRWGMNDRLEDSIRYQLKRISEGKRYKHWSTEFRRKWRKLHPLPKNTEG